MSVSDLWSHLTQANQRFDAANNHLNAIQSEVQTKTDAVFIVRSQVEQQTGNVDTETIALEQLSLALNDATLTLNAQTDVVSKAIDTLSQSNQRLDSANERLNKAITYKANATHQLSQATVRLTGANAKVSQANQSLANAQGVLKFIEGNKPSGPNGGRPSPRTYSEQIGVDEATGEGIYRQVSDDSLGRAYDQAMAEFRTAFSSWQGQVSDARSAALSAESQLSQANSELENAEQAFNGATQALENASIELIGAEENQKTAVSDVETAKAALEKAQEELKAAQTQLDKIQTEKQLASDRLITEMQTLTTLQEQLSKEEGELSSLLQQSEVATNDALQASAEMNAAQAAYDEAQAAEEAAKQAQLEAAQQDVAVNQDVVQSMEAQVVAEETQLEAAQLLEVAAADPQVQVYDEFGLPIEQGGPVSMMPASPPVPTFEPPQEAPEKDPQDGPQVEFPTQTYDEFGLPIAQGGPPSMAPRQIPIYGEDGRIEGYITEGSPEANTLQASIDPESGEVKGYAAFRGDANLEQPTVDFILSQQAFALQGGDSAQQALANLRTRQSSQSLSPEERQLLSEIVRQIEKEQEWLKIIEDPNASESDKILAETQFMRNQARQKEQAVADALDPSEALKVTDPLAFLEGQGIQSVNGVDMGQWDQALAAISPEEKAQVIRAQMQLFEGRQRTPEEEAFYTHLVNQFHGSDPNQAALQVTLDQWMGTSAQMSQTEKIDQVEAMLATTAKMHGLDSPEYLKMKQWYLSFDRDRAEAFDKALAEAKANEAEQWAFDPQDPEHRRMLLDKQKHLDNTLNTTQQALQDIEQDIQRFLDSGSDDLMEYQSLLDRRNALDAKLLTTVCERADVTDSGVFNWEQLEEETRAQFVLSVQRRQDALASGAIEPDVYDPTAQDKIADLEKGLLPSSSTPANDSQEAKNIAKIQDNQVFLGMLDQTQDKNLAFLQTVLGLHQGAEQDLNHWMLQTGIMDRVAEAEQNKRFVQSKSVERSNQKFQQSLQQLFANQDPNQPLTPGVQALAELFQGNGKPVDPVALKAVLDAHQGDPSLASVIQNYNRLDTALSQLNATVESGKDTLNFVDAFQTHAANESQTAFSNWQRTGQDLDELAQYSQTLQNRAIETSAKTQKLQIEFIDPDAITTLQGIPNPQGGQTQVLTIQNPVTGEEKQAVFQFNADAKQWVLKAEQSALTPETIQNWAPQALNHRLAQQRNAQIQTVLAQLDELAVAVDKNKGLATAADTLGSFFSWAGGGIFGRDANDTSSFAIREDMLKAAKEYEALQQLLKEGKIDEYNERSEAFMKNTVPNLYERLGKKTESDAIVGNFTKSGLKILGGVASLATGPFSPVVSGLVSSEIDQIDQYMKTGGFDRGQFIGQVGLESTIGFVTNKFGNVVQVGAGKAMGLSPQVSAIAFKGGAKALAPSTTVGQGLKNFFQQTGVNYAKGNVATHFVADTLGHAAQAPLSVTMDAIGKNLLSGKPVTLDELIHDSADNLVQSLVTDLMLRGAGKGFSFKGIKPLKQDTVLMDQNLIGNSLQSHEKTNFSVLNTNNPAVKLTQKDIAIDQNVTSNHSYSEFESFQMEVQNTLASKVSTQNSSVIGPQVSSYEKNSGSKPVIMVADLYPTNQSIQSNSPLTHGQMVVQVLENSHRGVKTIPLEIMGQDGKIDLNRIVKAIESKEIELPPGSALSMSLAAYVSYDEINRYFKEDGQLIEVNPQNIVKYKQHIRSLIEKRALQGDKDSQLYLEQFKLYDELANQGVKVITSAGNTDFTKNIYHNSHFNILAIHPEVVSIGGLAPDGTISNQSIDNSLTQIYSPYRNQIENHLGESQAVFGTSFSVPAALGTILKSPEDIIGLVKNLPRGIEVLNIQSNALQPQDSQSLEESSLLSPNTLEMQHPIQTLIPGRIVMPMDNIEIAPGNKLNALNGTYELSEKYNPGTGNLLVWNLPNGISAISLDTYQKGAVNNNAQYFVPGQVYPLNLGDTLMLGHQKMFINTPWGLESISWSSTNRSGVDSMVSLLTASDGRLFLNPKAYQKETVLLNGKPLTYGEKYQFPSPIHGEIQIITYKDKHYLRVGDNLELFPTNLTNTESITEWAVEQLQSYQNQQYVHTPVVDDITFNKLVNSLRDKILAIEEQLTHRAKVDNAKAVQYPWERYVGADPKSLWMQDAMKTPWQKISTSNVEYFSSEPMLLPTEGDDGKRSNPLGEPLKLS